MDALGSMFVIVARARRGFWGGFRLVVGLWFRQTIRAEGAIVRASYIVVGERLVASFACGEVIHVAGFTVPFVIGAISSALPAGGVAGMASEVVAVETVLAIGIPIVRLTIIRAHLATATAA